MDHPVEDAVTEVDATEPVLELLPALDEVDEVEEEPDNAFLSETDRLQSSDPLKLYVRQIGDGSGGLPDTITGNPMLARYAAVCSPYFVGMLSSCAPVTT